jgi:hypothetical protein
MKQAADEVLAELGIEDENLAIAKRLEEIALQDEYFIEKKTLSQRRLLLRHYSQSARHSNVDVYRNIRDRTDRGMDCTLERDDRRRVSHWST